MAAQVPTAVSDFVEMIFSNPPKEPCSFILIASQNSLPTLMNILIAGAHKLFGESIKPTDVSESQFALLQKYFKSFGYIIKYNYTYKNALCSEIAKINIWFQNYKPLKTCQGITLY
jgi:hypothetical protein